MERVGRRRGTGEGSWGIEDGDADILCEMCADQIEI